MCTSFTKNHFKEDQDCPGKHHKYLNQTEMSRIKRASLQPKHTTQQPSHETPRPTHPLATRHRPRNAKRSLGAQHPRQVGGVGRRERERRSASPGSENPPFSLIALSRASAAGTEGCRSSAHTHELVGGGCAAR